MIAANFSVSNINNSGPGSLRQAILDANANGVGQDTIDFDSSFSFPRTIVLTSGELDIKSSLIINGPGADLLTVSGNNVSRVFNIDGIYNVLFNHLTIANGNAETGGGIRIMGATVADSTIINNTAIGQSGGGINNSGVAGRPAQTLTITNSTIRDNTSSQFGGGLETFAAAIISNSTLVIIRQELGPGSRYGVTV